MRKTEAEIEMQIMEEEERRLTDGFLKLRKIKKRRKFHQKIIKKNKN